MPDSVFPHDAPSRIDRRIARTRQALREALQALIEVKGFDGVTVEEITQRANVGRATFYLHYRDKEEVLLEQLSELARDRVKKRGLDEKALIEGATIVGGAKLVEFLAGGAPCISY